jgi:hypothetical protein
MSGAQDKRLGASGARRNASTMNEASHRPAPTQIKTSTTSHTVFMDSSAKGVYTPMIVDNDQTDKLFKFDWVHHCTNEYGETAEREFAVKIATS